MTTPSSNSPKLEQERDGGESTERPISPTFPRSEDTSPTELNPDISNRRESGEVILNYTNDIVPITQPANSYEPEARKREYEDNEAEDETDGNMASSFVTLIDSVVDGPDDETKDFPKVQLSSCNQDPGSGNGSFLKMVLSGGSGLTVTTTGDIDDPYALWTTHYTVDEEKNPLAIFENEECTRKTGKKCVLYTEKNGDDYILTGKKILSREIPKMLKLIDPAYAFYRRPKAVGSELLYLKSMLGSKENPLLVGFDGQGQPLPLNKVRKYSRDFQAFFRMIQG